MTSFEVFRYHDHNNNTIKYLFNPSKRVEEGEGLYGTAILEKVTEIFDLDPDTLPLVHLAEPKPGTELFRYTAKDGADVRFQFDPTARNGMEYVTAIHRDPENWTRVRLSEDGEDLAVANEEELRSMYDISEEQVTMQTPRGTTTKRRDSLVSEEGIHRRVDGEMEL